MPPLPAADSGSTYTPSAKELHAENIMKTSAAGGDESADKITKEIVEAVEEKTDASDAMSETALVAHKSGGESTAAENWQRTRRRLRMWWKCFVQTDPRRHILQYFQPGDSSGPSGYLAAKRKAPAGGRSDYFCVWRPTSIKAISLMMQGKATGKGLNIKGKSAKDGELSGFVPVLQISEEAHKRLVGMSPRDARVRVYYRSEAARGAVRSVLQPICNEMMDAAAAGDAALRAEREGTRELSDEERAPLLQATFGAMDRPEMIDLDSFAPNAWVRPRRFRPPPHRLPRRAA